MCVEGGEKVMPGVGLGDLVVHACLQLAQGGQRFGPANDDLRTSECFDPLGSGNAGLDRLGEVTRADAGEEYDDIEPASEEAIGEGECGGIVGEGDFPEARSDERI